MANSQLRSSSHAAGKLPQAAIDGGSVSTPASPPTSPAGIVAEYAQVLSRYGIKAVTGDRYAGRWPRDEFLKHGVRYDVSELDRSALYLEMLAAMNSGRVELPPDDALARQLTALERRASRSGRDAIDHPPGGHDDRANAVAGLVASLTKRQGYSFFLTRALGGHNPTDEKEPMTWQTPA